MRKLLMACAGLVVFLGVVSGILWRDLRAERQLVSQMREQMTQAKLSEAGSAPLQEPQTTFEASATSVASAEVSDPAPSIASSDRPVPALQPATLSPAASMRLEEIQRAEVLRAADEAATARVFAWRDRLSIAGHTLTTAQLQALNAAAINEGRRGAEESLELARAIQPMDQADSFRLREEALVRAHETNLRILQTVGSQLTQEQANALRAQFETGHATRLAGVRAERERVELGAH